MRRAAALAVALTLLAALAADAQQAVPPAAKPKGDEPWLKFTITTQEQAVLRQHYAPATARSVAKTSEILDELEASHRAFVAAAAALGDEHLAPEAPARKIIDGTGPEHYRKHTAQIVEWRRGA